MVKETKKDFSFANELRCYRKTLSYSQSAMAEKLGVSLKTYKKWESLSQIDNRVPDSFKQEAIRQNINDMIKEINT